MAVKAGKGAQKKQRAGFRFLNLRADDRKRKPELFLLFTQLSVSTKMLSVPWASNSAI